MDVRVLLLLLSVSILLRAGAGQDLLNRLSKAKLNRAECYRVRDLQLTRDEAQLFFTDGYLIFGEASGPTPTTAFFSTEAEGGDAELLLLPPLRSERRALSAHSGSPNLEEHFTQAALVFTADTYRDLMMEIQRSPGNKKSAEMGVLLADRWSPLCQTLGTNFGLRLATDILSSAAAGRKGFFAAALAGTKLGSFNLVFDPRIPEQLLLGSPSDQGFNVWSSFTSKSFRAKPFLPEFVAADYRIEARLDANLNLRATTRLTVRPAENSTVLPLEMTDRMRVISASIDGSAAEILAREGQSTSGDSGYFVLVAAKPMHAGQSVELVVEHQGKVIQDAGNHVYFVGSRGTWYPNRGRQYANFDMTFRVPVALDLVAGGNLVEEHIVAQERISHWKTAVPIRLAGFNLGVYDRVKATRGGITVEVCANHSAEASLSAKPTRSLASVPPMVPGRPGQRPVPVDVPEGNPFTVSPKMRLEALAAEVGDAVDFYTARLGPLPWNRLEVTPVPARFGQGFPGIIYLSTLSYLEPREQAVAVLTERQQSFFTDLLHAHETAHQWWGNVVTSAAYHDDWLMEALANYSALLYLEKRKGTKVVDAILEDYRVKLLEKQEDGTTVESVGPIVQGTRLDRAWIPVVYGKGTWILHMLRRRMGDEPFLKMLQALRKEWETKPLGTEDFRLFCARFLPAGATDSKLETFFDQWVYGTGIPALKVTSAVKGGPGHWRATGVVTQTEAGEDFASEVPIEIQLGKGRVVKRVVTAGGEPVPFEFPLPMQPAKVSIDFRSILHR